MIRVDHLGTEFESQNAMCYHYGIDVGTFRTRLSSGCSLEQALTSTTVPHAKGHSFKCVDHEGREFSSLKELCKFHNAPYELYTDRRRKGWSIEEALFGRHSRRTAIPVEARTGPDGLVFDNQKEMCEHYGVNYSTFLNRFKNKHMTVAEALAKKSNSIEDRTDHLGNVYESISSMCNHYGVSIDTYSFRLKTGMDKESALTTSVGDLGHAIVPEEERTDPFGNVYRSRKEMCEKYDIPVNTYCLRLKRGCTQRQALGIDPVPRDRLKHHANSKLVYVDSNKIKYYYVQKGTYEEILSEDELELN